MMEKQTVRGFIFSDVFLVVKILKKIGITRLKETLTADKITELMNKDTEESSKILGFNLIMEVMGIVFENLELVEDDVYKLFAGLTGKDTEEVRNLPFGTVVEIVKEILGKDNTMDFFQDVSKLVN